MNNPVLVTGAGGFIGSAVIRRLVTGIRAGTLRFPDGSPVEHAVALVRKSTSLERLQELSGSAHWSVDYTDISDPLAFGKLLDRVRPRIIMHLALEAGVFTGVEETEMERLSEIQLETMFCYLAQVPGSRLIHTGSAWVLASGLALTEDAKVDPQSVYARIKFHSDRLLPALHSRFDVDWINLRIFNVYGKYESKKRLLPYLVSTLPHGKKARLSHGNQIRDFNNVEDIAEAYVLALQVDRSACGRIYHIGTGIGLSTREFAETVAEVTGNGGLIEYGSADQPDQSLAELVADPALARQKLGWSPPERPQDRIKDAARWWLEFNARS